MTIDVSQVQQRVASLSRRLDWLPPLLARLALAAVFVPSGWGKIHDLGKVTDFFTELHIPAPHLNAIVVSVSELVCGSLLAIGLLSRLATLPLIVSMVVALLTAKRDKIEGVVDLFSTDEFIYVVLLIGILVVGAGLASLDGIAARRLAKRTAVSSPAATPL
jgi:putative oxidoreductase